MFFANVSISQDVSKNDNWMENPNNMYYAGWRMGQVVLGANVILNQMDKPKIHRKCIDDLIYKKTYEISRSIITYQDTLTLIRNECLPREYETK